MLIILLVSGSYPLKAGFLFYMIKKCKFCKNTFKTYHKNSKFCNIRCYANFQLNRPKKEKLTYNGVHSWVKIHYKKSNICEHCKKNPGLNKRGFSKIQWANKSGKYKREREGWICLCQSCHSKYDFNKERYEHLCKMSVKSVKLQSFKERKRNKKGQFI